MHKNNKPRQKAGLYNLFLTGVNTHNLNHTGHVYAKSTVSCKKLSSFIRAHQYEVTFSNSDAACFSSL